MRFRFDRFLMILFLFAMTIGQASSAFAFNPWCRLIGTCEEASAAPPTDVEAQRLDAEFVLVYGERPTIAQYGSLRPWQAAMDDYKQNRNFFGGLSAVPPGAENAFKYYEQMGVPFPLFYVFKGEERAMFILPPDPEEGQSWRNEDGQLYVKHRKYVSDSAAGATTGNIYRNVVNWQAETVRRGVCVPNLHPYLFIAKVSVQNKINCNGK